MVIALSAWLLFPKYPQKVEQHKSFFLRKHYWLYYALIFLSGTRRQIFVVFAGFMMVEKFAYSVSSMIALLWLNHSVNTFLAPYIGKLIHRWGERSTLTFEYIGLIGLFLPLIHLCLILFGRHRFMSLIICFLHWLLRLKHTSRKSQIQQI